MEQKPMFIDPVCGMKVDLAEHDDSLHTLKYEEKDYYFCSPFCIAAFLEDPERYTHGNNVISDENESSEIED
jgi:YHS domain-containing protein